MYAEVKNGPFIPNCDKNTASVSPSAHSHLEAGLHGPFAPLFPEAQALTPTRLSCPHSPRAVLQDFSSMQRHWVGWAPTRPAPGRLPPSPSKAQPLDNADTEREPAATTTARPVAEKSREADSILTSKGSAVWRAKQQDPVGGTAGPCGSPLFPPEKPHSSLKTVPLRLWPHKALLTTAAIKSRCKNRD